MESSSLTKPEELIVDKAVLKRIYLLYVVYDRPTCPNYKVTNKSSVPMDTPTPMNPSG